MTEVAHWALPLPGQMYPMNSQRCEHVCGARSHSRPKNRMAVFALCVLLLQDTHLNKRLPGRTSLSLRKIFRHKLLSQHLNGVLGQSTSEVPPIMLPKINFTITSYPEPAKTWGLEVYHPGHFGLVDSGIRVGLHRRIATRDSFLWPSDLISAHPGSARHRRRTPTIYRGSA